MSRLLKTSILMVVSTSFLACAGEGSLSRPELDLAVFDAQVYPVLLRDCGFPACHGSRDRFFRVFGPGRVRLDPSTRLTGPVTTEELDEAYERARSMVESIEAGGQSPLVRKPLEVDQGGASHGGTDDLGRDVYASMEDPGFSAIHRWVRGEDVLSPYQAGTEESELRLVDVGGSP